MDKWEFKRKYMAKHGYASAGKFRKGKSGGSYAKVAKYIKQAKLKKAADRAAASEDYVRSAQIAQRVAGSGLPKLFLQFERQELQRSIQGKKSYLDTGAWELGKQLKSKNPVPCFFAD